MAMASQRAKQIMLAVMSRHTGSGRLAVEAVPGRRLPARARLRQGSDQAILLDSTESD